MLRSVLTVLCGWAWLAGPALGCADLPSADAGALTLAQAQARVADCHPDVRAARAALGGAVADVQVAGQRPNPQLTVGAGSVGSALGSGSPWRKTFDHSLRIDQLIERGNKPALRQATAEALRSAAAADLADVTRRALSAVAHAHQDLWAAQGRRLQLAAAVGLSAESLRLLDLRVRAGDAPALDATRFTLDNARVRADLRQAEADVADGQRQLALLIGVGGLGGAGGAGSVNGLPSAASGVGQLQALAADLPAGAPDRPGAPLPPSAERSADGVERSADAKRSADGVERSADAAERRADVAAALARLAAAELARDLAAAARTRDVSVGLQVDHWPTSAGNGSGTGNTVSLSLTVPLFVRHANDGELARAEADLGAARESLRRVRDAASADLAHAAAQASAAADRRQLVLAQLEPAAEKVAAGAELAYRRGASTALDVLDARRSLRAVRIERITADADLAKALADWQAAGLPLPAPPAR